MRFYVKPRPRPTIIVVTMIDVFCVLLIFFIVATTFRKSMPAIRISLPEAKSGVPVNQTDPLILSVTSDEKIFLNAREIPLSQLEDTFARLGKQSPQPAIAIQADKKAPFGLIFHVIDSAKAAGFTQLPAFVEQESQGKP